MLSWIPLVLAFAAFVTAQGSSSNVINNPPAGIEAKAGEPLTITWANPSSGPVTIKIQTGSSTQPGDGIVVAENIPNTGTATFNVPSDVPVGQVYVQIVDETDPSNSNFSGGFEVQGATNTATVAANTASVASASISASSASASSASESSASVSSSVSASESSASESSASASSSSSLSSESATARSSSSASATSASTSISNSTAVSSRSSQTASRTSSASATSESTTAPSNAAMLLPVHLSTGLLAVMFGAAAALL